VNRRRFLAGIGGMLVAAQVLRTQVFELIEEEVEGYPGAFSLASSDEDLLRVNLLSEEMLEHVKNVAYDSLNGWRDVEPTP